MTTPTIQKDFEKLTMNLVVEFDAPIDRVWEMWSNPHLLERWWGPPTYPATVVEHDLRSDGKVSYFMTGPQGETPRGLWKVLSVNPPNDLEVEDWFADDDGNPSTDMPTTKMKVNLTQTGNKTRMAILSTFPSAEAMEQIIAMGVEEGITAAIGQIEGLLQELAATS